MPPRSKIKLLPRETRARIDAYLAEAERGVDEFVAFLSGEIGLEIGRSSAHRYQQDFDSIASKLRESREMASALAEEIGPGMAAGKTGRVLTEILQKIVFDHLLVKTESGDTGTPMDLMLLAKAIKDTVGTLKIDTDRERQVRQDVARSAADRAVKAADEQSRAAGHKLPPEALKAIREQVYGVVDG